MKTIARNPGPRAGAAGLAALAVVAALHAFPAVAADTGTEVESAKVEIAIPGVERVDLVREAGGEAFVYRVLHEDGREERLTPEAFAATTWGRDVGRPLWQRFLNISSAFGIAWVALGLLGQALFSGRMLVQWLASEKARRSVVPEAFWWMSLLGASMLMAYFVWRKDVVGVLGQSVGWLIYARNLVLIRRGGSEAPLGA